MGNEDMGIMGEVISSLKVGYPWKEQVENTVSYIILFLSFIKDGAITTF